MQTAPTDKLLNPPRGGGKQESPEQAPGHLIKPSRCQFSRIFFISGVAASVSEWQLIHSLTLAATTRSSRSQLRGIGPIANENSGR
jgi:hypothetical protein